jgi:hypothetical protein
MSCPMQLRPHLKRVTTENPTLWELSGQDGYSIVEARRLTTQLTEDLSACSMQKTPFSIPWFAVALCVSGSISLYGRFYSITLLGYYNDDAFYYFQIARNIVTLHRSSFDGAHLTNGYHPLWMLTLVGLDLLSSGKTFFFLLQCIALASFMTTYVASRGIFRIFSDNSTLAEIAASAVALQCLLLIRDGMEITLTIPLTLLPLPVPAAPAVPVDCHDCRWLRTVQCVDCCLPPGLRTFRCCAIYSGDAARPACFPRWLAKTGDRSTVLRHSPVALRTSQS